MQQGSTGVVAIRPWATCIGFHGQKEPRAFNDSRDVVEQGGGIDFHFWRASLADELVVMEPIWAPGFPS